MSTHPPGLDPLRFGPLRFGPLRFGLLLLALAASAGLASANGRWSAEDYAGQSQEGLVWASGSACSSFKSNSFKPEGALGKADVFPKFDVSARIWSPKSTASEEDWLELTFPETAARQVRIFETTRPGCIAKVIDVATGDVLHAETVENALHRFKGAQVLYVDLDPARKLTKLRIYVRPKDAGFSSPGIDAVALVPAGKQAAPPPPAKEGKLSVVTGRWSVDDYKAKAKEAEAKGKTADMARAVWPKTAAASSQMGDNQSPAMCVGKPQIWPKHAMGLPFKGGGWAPKDSASEAEWLELSYPATSTREIHVFETCLPGQVRKVEVDGKVVYDKELTKDAYKVFNQKAQVFWLQFSAPVKVTKVKLWFAPKVDFVRPGIDTVGLVPAE